MKSLWSLSKLANEIATAPAPTASPSVQTPSPAVAPSVAPQQSPTPAATPATPQAPAVNLTVVEQIKTGPEGQAMLVFINQNRRTIQQGAKEQLEKWNADPNTKKALQDIGFNHLRQEWPKLIKRISTETPAAPPPENAVKPESTGLEQLDGDENELSPKAMSREAQLDQYADKFIKPIMTTFMSKYQSWLMETAAKMGDKGQFLLSAPENAFQGFTLGRKKKWKQFFEINPGYFDDDGQHGSTREAINADIEQALAKNAEPEVIQTLKDVVNSNAPEDVNAVKDWIKRCAATLNIGDEKGQQGKSLNNAAGENAEVGDFASMKLEEDRRRGQENALNDKHPDEAAAMDRVMKAFMASPANQKILQDLKDLTRSASSSQGPAAGADVMVRDGIDRVFGGYNNLQEHGQWKDFYLLHPNLLQQNNTLDPQRAIERNKPALMQQMEQFAASGQPDLQKWVSEHAKEFITENIANKVNFATTIRQMDHMTRTVVSWMENQASSAKKQWEDAQKTGKDEKSKNAGKANYITIARRAEAIRAKMDAAVANLRSVFDGKQKDFVGEDGERMTVRLKNDKGKNSGRLYVVGKDGFEKEMDAKTFYQLSRIITPSSWVPTYIENVAKKDPMLLLKTSNQRKRSDAQKANEEAVLSTLQQEARPPKDGDPGDRLAGYRKRMGALLLQALQAKGMTPEQAAQHLAAEEGQAASPEDIEHFQMAINSIINGGQEGTPPIELSDKWAEEISGALGIAKDSWFFSSPEYDPYNADDISNINATSEVAVDSYAPFFLHKKRQALHRNKSWVSPNALYYWISIMRPYSQVARGTHPNEKNLDAVRRKTKLLYQLIPAESPISSQHDPVQILENIKSVEGEPDLYDYYGGHEPTSGKRYVRIPEVKDDGGNVTDPERIQRHHYEVDPGSGSKKKQPNTPEQPKPQFTWQTPDSSGQPIPRHKRKHRLIKNPDEHVYGPRRTHKFDSTTMGRFLRAMYELDRLEQVKINRLKYASSCNNINAMIDAITERAMFDIMEMASYE